MFAKGGAPRRLLDAVGLWFETLHTHGVRSFVPSTTALRSLAPHDKTASRARACVPPEARMQRWVAAAGATHLFTC